MARFDLSKYATVAERLAMVEAEWPDFRVETTDYSTPEDRAKGIWRVKAYLYLTKEDQIEGTPKATGHAFEVDSNMGPTATSGLEVCETSAVGRCLALASTRWSGNKDDAGKSLASREEMEKVQRGKTAKPATEVPDGFTDCVEKCDTLPELTALWDEATSLGFSNNVVTVFSKRKAEIGNG
jgi:hypothetical protein